MGGGSEIPGPLAQSGRSEMSADLQGLCPRVQGRDAPIKCELLELHHLECPVSILYLLY